MTPIQQAARALFTNAVGGSRLDLADYDHDPERQAVWAGIAERALQGNVVTA
ncbi:hypothetical protein [Arthrobacter sp. Soil763]|uniref:hypothetical protein n=1 Tax=Arthrobacter sp. Soil763 TaxID=1736402 RepID=UPI000A849BA7|nr:hypothetical protein [Arthrobacter sp. Soil763]